MLALRLLLFCYLLTIFGLFLPVSRVNAAQLSERGVRISDSVVSRGDITYTVAFKTTTAGVLKGIVVDFCSNSPFIGQTCTPPTGFDSNEAGLAIANQAGIAGFSIHPNTDSNTVIITNPLGGSLPINTAVSFDLGASGASDGITSGSSAGTFYARVATYTSDAMAAAYDPVTPGSYTDFGGTAAALIGSGLGTSGFVEPFLVFCVGLSVSGNCTSVSGAATDLGELSSSQTRFTTSQFAGATNDPTGYSVSANGTTMTSGSNVINAVNPAAASIVGTSQFGLNLRANALPAVGQNPSGAGTLGPTGPYNTPNFYKYASGEVIASSPLPTDYNIMTVSYIVNVPAGQAAGVYATTLTYIATAAF